jgi:hypothetical protein
MKGLTGFEKIRGVEDVASLLIRESIAEGLRDGSEKHGEGFVYWPCAGLAANSPDRSPTMN